MTNESFCCTRDFEYQIPQSTWLFQLSSSGFFFLGQQLLKYELGLLGLLFIGVSKSYWNNNNFILSEMIIPNSVPLSISFKKYW